MKILFICFLAWSTCQFKSDQNENSQWPWNSLLKVNQIEIPIYNKPKKGDISHYIMNDTLSEEFYLLEIVEKKTRYFKVRTASSFSETTVKEGWIEEKYVGIYLRPLNKNSVYPLYIKPSEQSISNNIVSKSNEMVDVVDIFKNWLKIRLLVGGKFQMGWIPNKYLCSNPYSTCN